MLWSALQLGPDASGDFKHAPLDPASPSTPQRRAERFPIVAAAEIVALDTDTGFDARTSDLSVVGCYLDISNPLPVGTEIKVRRLHQARFTKSARRMASHSSPCSYWRARPPSTAFLPDVLSVQMHRVCVDLARHKPLDTMQDHKDRKHVGSKVETE